MRSKVSGEELAKRKDCENRGKWKVESGNRKQGGRGQFDS